MRFIPLSFISSTSELERQIVNTVVFTDLLKKYPSTQLGNCLESTQYGFTASAKETGLYRLVRITDINESTVNWQTVPLCDCESPIKYLLKANDVLVARTGGTTGKSFLVNDPPDNAIYASYLIRLRVRNDVNPLFIQAFLNSYNYWEQIAEVKSGASQPNVNAEKLKKLVLPECPLNIQNQIVNLLLGKQANSWIDIANHIKSTLQQFSEIIVLEAELKTQRTLLTQLRQSVLQEAVQGKLTNKFIELAKTEQHDDVRVLSTNSSRTAVPQPETGADLLARIRAEKAELIRQGKLRKEKPLPPVTDAEKPFELPEGWVWCRLGEIAIIKGGKRVPAGYKLLKAPTPYIYIRVSDMANGTISNSDLHYIDETIFKQIKHYTISKDDLYMTIVGATIGKCGFVPEEFDGMSLTENAAKVTPLICSKEYLHLTFSSSLCQSQFYDKTKQVGVQKMALNRFENTLIPLPSFAEQQAIIARMEHVMNQVNALETENKQQQAEISRLMQAVLSEAFTGEKELIKII